MWRPELSFFEERSGLLRELEDAQLLDEFRWTVDDVTVKIGQFEGLRVGVNGATVYVMSPRTEGERTRAALEMVLERLKPRDIVLGSIHLQRFVEIHAPAAEVQASSAQDLVGNWMPSATAGDWALLLDGSSRLAPGPFQVEFGVVSQSEAGIRLSASIGRLESPELPFQPDLEGLPGCSFFFSWLWATDSVVSSEPMKEMMAVWEAVLSETDKLSNEVKGAYMTIQGRQEEHG